eukprot:2814409-Rhodomonas_salina.1
MTSAGSSGRSASRRRNTPANPTRCLPVNWSLMESSGSAPQAPTWCCRRRSRRSKTHSSTT